MASVVRVGNLAIVKAGLLTAVFSGVGSAATLGLQVMVIVPIAVCTLLGDQVKAAIINTEATAPQRPANIAPRNGAVRAVATRPVSASTARPASTIAAPITTKAAPATPLASPNRTNDGVPDQSWGGPRINVPAQAIPRAQVRQVSVPVLGREGPAARAVAAKPAGPAPAPRAITITASEPTLTSMVRPQDVAVFQKIGAPYQVNGTWYVPAHEPDYDETGVASWYGADFQGRPTANGEIFDMNVVSGAHPTLPIPSLVEVTNLSNGRSIVVRVNDRGPFISSRLIDMSARGAELLGFRQQGHTNVRVRYVGPATPEPVVTADNISTGRASVVAQAVSPKGAAPTGSAYVQVGAFSQLANAQRVRDEAATLGPVAVIETSQADGNPLYRVVLGPVPSRIEADAKAQAMSTNGFTGARVLASLN